MPGVHIGAEGDSVGFVVLDNVLGAPGEQGEVWQAHLKDYDSVSYAVKISRQPVAGARDPAFREFTEEFEALASLSHESIVKVYYVGIFTKGGHRYPFYIMEYLGDEVFPLKDLTEKAPPELQLYLSLVVLFRIASALKLIHNEADRNHGDIKNSNIVIRHSEREGVSAKLIDFGFSRLLPAAAGGADAAALAGRQTSQISSLHRPRPTRSLLHTDIWQLSTTFRWLLAGIVEGEAPAIPDAQSASAWPVDYAHLPQLIAFLRDWASVDPDSLPETADVEDFYEGLSEFEAVKSWRGFDPDVRGGLRYYRVPEIATAGQVIRAFEAIRIPPRKLVLYTERIKRLISTSKFGGLRYTRQLGFTHLVYPGAKGTRFEHALGVFALACRFIIRMASHPAFRRTCPEDKDVVKFLVLSLLHDVCHYPYAHQLEEFTDRDFRAVEWARVKDLVGGHSNRGKAIISSLQTDLCSLFGFDASDVAEIEDAVYGDSAALARLPTSLGFLRGLLDGPIDLDKLDYVERDAHHCGVPYGNYLDIDRVIETVRVLEPNGGQDGPVVGWHRRGLGCLEQVATARHQLYAYVYWHRAVRSATVMFKHAFYLFQSLFSKQELERVFYESGSDDCLLKGMQEELRKRVKLLRRKEDLTPAKAKKSAAIRRLLEAVAGRERVLYKAVLERDGDDGPRGKVGGFSYRSQREKARQVYRRLREARMLAPGASKLGEHNVLIDCRTDKVVGLEGIKIVDDTGNVEEFGDCVPSIRQLRETFRKEACRVRVYVNPGALKKEFRGKGDRGPVTAAVAEELEL